MTTNQDFLTVHEAAHVYGRHVTALREAMRCGRLGIYYTSERGAELLARNELETYAAESKRRSEGARDAWSRKARPTTPAGQLEAVQQLAAELPAKPEPKPAPVLGMVWVQDNTRNDWCLVKGDEYDAGQACNIHGRCAQSSNTAAWKAILYPSFTGSDYRVTYLPYEMVRLHGLPAVLKAILLKDILTRNEKTVEEAAGRILLD